MRWLIGGLALLALVFGFVFSSRPDRVVQKTVEDAAAIVERALNRGDVASVEPLFATAAEGANEAGLDVTWGALRQFAENLGAGERVQFHFFPCGMWRCISAPLVEFRWRVRHIACT